MKLIHCKLLACPRLDEIRTNRGNGILAKCNQHMPDTAVYYADCEAVSRERCKELRKALKQKQETVQ